jgi:tRNA(adenine34) deaminase
MPKKKSSKQLGEGAPESDDHRWVAKVKTDSTHPPEGLFTKDAATIARALASKKVSPKGPASGMRMLTYFMNRAGKNLTAASRKELQKAKKLLSSRIAKARDKVSAAEKTTAHRRSAAAPR